MLWRDFEKVVLPWLDEIEEERSALNPDNPWLGLIVELCFMGDRIEDETFFIDCKTSHTDGYTWTFG